MSYCFINEQGRCSKLTSHPRSCKIKGGILKHAAFGVNFKPTNRHEIGRFPNRGMCIEFVLFYKSTRWVPQIFAFSPITYSYNGGTTIFALRSLNTGQLEIKE
jgi:hypothetical protein